MALNDDDSTIPVSEPEVEPCDYTITKGDELREMLRLRPEAVGE